jgi:hypothetical protein
LKVVVVLHQGESVNVHALQARSIADDPEEDVVVVVLIEDRHAVDASVHDMDAQAFDVSAKGTRHAGIPSKKHTNCWATTTTVFPRARTEIVAESAIYRAGVVEGTSKYPAPDRTPDPAPDRTQCPTLYLTSRTGSVMNEGCCADLNTLCVAFTLGDKYHTFLKGHRVMVQIQSSWFPMFDRNPQTFVDIYHAKDSDYRKATHKVFRSARLPSFVTLPVLDAR